MFEITADELIKDEYNKFDISKVNILDILREQKEMRLKGNLYHQTQISFAYNTNHFKLIDYMLDIADKKLTEKMIKDFHKILKAGTSDSRAEWFNVGEYKQRPNMIGNGIKTTLPNNVGKEMSKLMEWYNSLKQVTIKEIIEFHYRFESIHPFQDGNGRVGRIIMFKECLKSNIVPFIIHDVDKLFYYRGLREYKKEYMTDTCLNAQDQYAKMVEYYMGFV